MEIQIRCTRLNSNRYITMTYKITDINHSVKSDTLKVYRHCCQNGTGRNTLFEAIWMRSSDNIAEDRYVTATSWNYIVTRLADRSLTYDGRKILALLSFRYWQGQFFFQKWTVSITMDNSLCVKKIDKFKTIQFNIYIYVKMKVLN